MTMTKVIVWLPTSLTYREQSAFLAYIRQVTDWLPGLVAADCGRESQLRIVCPVLSVYSVSHVNLFIHVQVFILSFLADFRVLHACLILSCLTLSGFFHTEDSSVSVFSFGLFFLLLLLSLHYQFSSSPEFPLETFLFLDSSFTFFNLPVLFFILSLWLHSERIL